MSLATANTHRIQQVRLSASTEQLIARLYRRIIDPYRIEATYPAFIRAAELVIGRGRAASRALAREYYLAEAAAHGHRAAAEALQVRPLGPGQAAASLYATGAARAITQMERGAPPSTALAAGEIAARRSAKRLILNGGREYLVEVSNLDPRASGYARISDGAPCHFCAMLVSRGPVYDVDTVDFKAHDGCGCGVRLVYPEDPDRGWGGQALSQRALWESTGDLSTFRRVTRALRLGRMDGLLKRLKDEGLSDEALERIALAADRVRRTDPASST